MARIAEKHKRYRTKEQIAADLAVVLAAPLSYGTKFAVLKEATWVWTEFEGKYKGCKFWSTAALAEKRANPKSRNLRHEHVVPKKVVIDLLMQLNSPTPETVRALCDRFLIGVVVTLEEDAALARFRDSMPQEFSDRKNL